MLENRGLIHLYLYVYMHISYTNMFIIIKKIGAVPDQKRDCLSGRGQGGHKKCRTDVFRWREDRAQTHLSIFAFNKIDNNVGYGVLQSLTPYPHWIRLVFCSPPQPIPHIAHSSSALKTYIFTLYMYTHIHYTCAPIIMIIITKWEINKKNRN